MKRFTWKKWLIITPAIAAGITIFLYIQYKNNGSIATIDFVVAVVSFLIGLGIVARVAHWVNKFENDEKF